MANFDWQNLIVLLIVATAASYLAALAWPRASARKQTGCGSCGSCPASVDAPQEPAPWQLITVDELRSGQSANSTSRQGR